MEGANVAMVETTVSTPVMNIREAEEQCKRITDLLSRFEGILETIGIAQARLENPNTIDREVPSEPPGLASVAVRVNNSSRVNANRLGDLLDKLAAELT